MNKRGFELNFTLIVLGVAAIIALFVIFGLSGQSTKLIGKVKSFSDAKSADLDLSLAKDNPDLLFEKGVQTFTTGIEDDDKNSLRTSFTLFSEFLKITDDDDFYNSEKQKSQYYLGILSYYLDKTNMISLLENQVSQELDGFFINYNYVSRAYLILAHSKSLNWGEVLNVYKEGELKLESPKDKTKKVDFLTYLNEFPEETDKLIEYRRVHTKVVRTVARACLNVDSCDKNDFYEKHKTEIDGDLKLKEEYSKSVRK